MHSRVKFNPTVMVHIFGGKNEESAAEISDLKAAKEDQDSDKKGDALVSQPETTKVPVRQLRLGVARGQNGIKMVWMLE